MQRRGSVAWVILASSLIVCAFAVQMASRGPTVRRASAPDVPLQSSGGAAVWPPDRGLPLGLDDVFPYARWEACPSVPIAARLALNHAMLDDGRFGVETVSLILDGRDVSSEMHVRFSNRDAEIGYRPPDAQSAGRHEVRLTYPAGDGAVQEYSWTFDVSERGCSPYPADNLDVRALGKVPLTWKLAQGMEEFLSSRVTCPTPTLSIDSPEYGDELTFRPRGRTAEDRADHQMVLDGTTIGSVTEERNGRIAFADRTHLHGEHRVREPLAPGRHTLSLSHPTEERATGVFGFTFHVEEIQCREPHDRTRPHSDGPPPFPDSPGGPGHRLRFELTLEGTVPRTDEFQVAVDELHADSEFGAAILCSTNCRGGGTGFGADLGRTQGNTVVEITLTRRHRYRMETAYVGVRTMSRDTTIPVTYDADSPEGQRVRLAE